MWRKVSRALSEERGKPVRIVEKTSSLKALLTQILSPARILSVNTVWLPDGSWESSVKVPISDLKRLPAEPGVLEALIKALTNEKVTITPAG
jgi:transcription antitermination factor NusA-like protein